MNQTVRKIFEGRSAALLAEPDKYTPLNVILIFEIEREEDILVWTFRCLDPLSIEEGRTPADEEKGSVIRMSEESLVGIIEDALSPQALFLSGAISVRGDFESAIYATLVLFGETGEPRSLRTLE